MEFRIRRSFQVLAPGSSLRRRVAYSLVIVRLILVPVIFLAVYYLLQIGLVGDGWREARAKKLTAKQRKQIAQKAAKARWQK